MFVAVDLFAFGADHKGHLGPIDPRFGIGQRAESLILRHDHHVVVVTGHQLARLGTATAITTPRHTIFFQGLGLLAVVNHRDHLPVAVKAVDIVVGKGKADPRGEFRQVTLGLGGGGVGAQGL